MKKLIKKEKTNNILLRFIGNICGSIFTFFLIKEIKAEDKSHKIRAKIFAKICNPFGKAQNKWATYYI
jgi:formate/nitrite transporter FocA (FNT family)